MANITGDNLSQGGRKLTFRSCNFQVEQGVEISDV